MVFLTDERGVVRDRSLSPGTYFVSAKRYGFLDLYNPKTSQYGEYVELTAAKTTKVRLTLTRNVPLGGTLVDSHGLPVFNAWIGAQAVVQLPSGGYAKDDSRPYTAGNTDRSGGFTMKEALAGNYLLFVRGEGLVPFWMALRAPDASVRLQAPAGGVVVGKIVDEHGVPVEGAIVEVPHVKDTRVPTLDPENADKVTRTSASGDFRIEGLGPGALTVRATLFGLEAGGARCEPSQPTAEKAVEVKLDRESRVLLRLPPHQCWVQ